MSTDEAISPDEFAELTPAEREDAMEAVSEATGDGGDGDGYSSFFDVDVFDLFDRLPDGLVSGRGEGKTVEEIQEEYSVGDGPAYIVRGVTRWFGVDDVPPIAEMAIGLYLMLKP
jgi:hypothetical protein